MSEINNIMKFDSTIDELVKGHCKDTLLLTM